ncbi:hypothetical protein AJ80_00886 [Polytolypa hystricis UAMH7299]|uniref:tRNA (guanine(10)-N(2))-methyltransferase n=1 Tax=Polytolypa hystricis (strain UAMH7299) TaxID=1447883 RepID=A0A2B7Z2R1_POLH7|nr:hypothetical protein AJ80_00886 [Polytolypa hystricis UAMH7299]
MEYLIRFAQTHESFRKPEIEALAAVTGIKIELLVYDDASPFCIIKTQDEASARALIARSVLTKNVYEVWGQGNTYPELHADVQRRTKEKWSTYMDSSFRFSVDTYAAKRGPEKKTEIIQSFSYTGFKGQIKMVNPEEEFAVFEEFSLEEAHAYHRGEISEFPDPKRLYFGRWIAQGGRDIVDKYDLKKRDYISTTSMDAELSLVTANMALAAPGKVFYDPFVGTGSFCVAAAHFGADVMGSDIDGRSYRGNMSKREKIGLVANLEQYGLKHRYLDAFTSDLTNTPIRDCQFLDGIICDPPYGVREGLKVLGSKEGKRKEIAYMDGIPTYTMEGYIAPKKPYSFDAMLDDLLDFAARTLVEDGRLSFWMPTANDEAAQLAIPSNPYLEFLSASVQPFNSWSRRLLTYRRRADAEVSQEMEDRQRDAPIEGSADELNTFRRKYFRGFPRVHMIPDGKITR